MLWISRKERQYVKKYKKEPYGNFRVTILLAGYWMFFIIHAFNDAGAAVKMPQFLSVLTDNAIHLVLLGIYLSLAVVFSEMRLQWTKDNPRGGILVGAFQLVAVVTFLFYIAETDTNFSYYTFLKGLQVSFLSFVGVFIFVAIDGRSKRFELQGRVTIGTGKDPVRCFKRTGYVCCYLPSLSPYARVA